MKYAANAYLCTNFAGLMESLETDDFSEVQDFVWKYCQNGLNCEVIDNETGDRCLYDADAFTEYTEDTDELLRDLRMEQCEQM